MALFKPSAAQAAHDPGGALDSQPVSLHEALVTKSSVAKRHPRHGYVQSLRSRTGDEGEWSDGNRGTLRKRVGMQELDQRLAKIVEARRASNRCRCTATAHPWVWIVSQDDWQSALKEVSSCIPPGHSLVMLKPRVEELLAAHAQGWPTWPGATR